MTPIPGRDLLGYQTALKMDLFRAVRKHFKDGEITYAAVAERLGIAQWRVERMLNGEQDLRLDQLSDLARALDARFQIKLVTFEEIRKANAQFAALDRKESK